MIGRVVVEVKEDNHAAVFVRGLEPYDAIRVLVSTVLALLDGSAEVSFNDGSPLTEEQEQEIINSMIEGAPLTGGDEKGN